jgi:hypothetical protein
MRFSIHCLMLALALPISAAEAVKESKVPAPPMPAVKSPVETFRELLDMNANDRARELSKKAEKFRKVIEERLKEFDAMPREQRQTRLRLMQLRWELLPLLQARSVEPATNTIPEQDRPLIIERLRYWQKLPADLQKLVLENEMVMHYFLTGQLALTNTADLLQPPARGLTLTNVQRWRELSPDEQRQAYEAFRQIFDLGKKDRDKLFSEASDRRRIEGFLKTFEKLPVEERERRMASFQKFTSMSVEQRLQFLQNARRWETMSESERAVVRSMINAPPIPPLPSEFFRPSVSNASVVPVRD